MPKTGYADVSWEVQYRDEWYSLVPLTMPAMARDENLGLHYLFSREFPSQVFDPDH